MSPRQVAVRISHIGKCLTLCAKLRDCRKNASDPYPCSALPREDCQKVCHWSHSSEIKNTSSQGLLFSFSFFKNETIYTLKGLADIKSALVTKTLCELM